jgi:hypothetical protein
MKFVRSYSSRDFSSLECGLICKWPKEAYAVGLRGGEWIRMRQRTHSEDCVEHGYSGARGLRVALLSAPFGRSSVPVTA